MYARLPRDFATLPNQPLEIRRVPPEIQDGASNGYYRRAALDGSRPAIYFINLKDLGDWPKYTLPTLSYHEGVPGHHLQISIAQESKDIPTLRKLGFFSAYSKAGRFTPSSWPTSSASMTTIRSAAPASCSRSCSAPRASWSTPGIHTKRWSREQATDYMVQTTGFARPRSQREVERYCTLIGQACSYKVGHTAWTRARAEAQKTLGRSSTSSSSTKCCAKARCRCRSSSAGSANGRQQSADAPAAAGQRPPPRAASGFSARGGSYALDDCTWD